MQLRSTLNRLFVRQLFQANNNANRVNHLSQVKWSSLTKGKKSHDVIMQGYILHYISFVRNAPIHGYVQWET